MAVMWVILKKGKLFDMSHPNHSVSIENSSTQEGKLLNLTLDKKNTDTYIWIILYNTTGVELFIKMNKLM